MDYKKLFREESGLDPEKHLSIYQRWLTLTLEIKTRVREQTEKVKTDNIQKVMEDDINGGN